MNVAGVKGDLVAAVEAVADQLGDDDRLDVRRAHVAACPAAAALDGDGGFEANPATTAWQLAAAAGDRLVNGSADPNRGRPPSTPSEALDLAAEETSDDWAFDWWAGSDEPARSVARADVVRRIAGLARLASTWPPPEPVKYGHRPSWTFPQGPLRLAGRVDLVAGRRGHDHTVVVALPGDHGPLTRARLAYEALVETVALNRPPAYVLGLLPDAGRRWRIAVDEALLAEGVAAAGVAARVALGARRRDDHGLERRPSPRCRWCQHRGDCPEGAAWLDGPGRLRSGFLPPPA
jgi:hypothetical protein